MKGFLIFILFSFFLGSKFCCAQSNNQIKIYVQKAMREKKPRERLLLLHEAEEMLLKKIDLTNLIINSDIKYYFVSPQEAFNFHLRKWEKKFDKKKITSILDQIIADPSKKWLKTKEGDFLIVNRRRAHFLRLYYHGFSSKHSPPKIFNQYVVTLGDLKDAIRNKKKNKTVKMAQKLKQILLENNLKKEVESIRYISEKNFKNYYLHLIQDIITQSSQDSLSPHQFHELRKKIKNIQFIISTVVGDNEKLEEEYNLLRRIDHIRETMGDVNQLYVDLKYQNIINYKKHSILVATELKEALENISAQTQQIICQVKFK